MSRPQAEWVHSDATKAAAEEGRAQVAAVLRTLFELDGTRPSTLSLRLGMSNARLGNWVRGDRNPTVPMLDAVAAELGYRLRLVLECADPQPRAVLEQTMQPQSAADPGPPTVLDEVVHAHLGGWW